MSNIYKFPRLAPIDMTYNSLVNFNKRVQEELGNVHSADITRRDTDAKRYRQKYNRIRREYVIPFPKGLRQ